MASINSGTSITMAQEKPKTFDAIAKAMIDDDVDNGHIGSDAPVWGRYQSLTRAGLEVLKRRFAGTPGQAMIDDVLNGKT